MCGTLLCVFVLVFYSISTLSHFDEATALGTKFTNGFSGVMQGLPFALQFIDGFEELPLLIGEHGTVIWVVKW